MQPNLATIELPYLESKYRQIQESYLDYYYIR